jgi:hypothetical protein
MSGPPILTFGTVNQFQLMYCDKGSGADMDGSFYRGLVQGDTTFLLGDYAQGNYNAPSGSLLTVSVQNDDPNSPALLPPTGYALIWGDQGSGADMDGSIWMPIAPQGYVALGAVSQTGYNTPYIPNLRCIRFDLVKPGIIGSLIWNDQGSGAHMDVACYATNAPGLFYAQGNYNAPTGPVWLPTQLNSSL